MFSYSHFYLNDLFTSGALSRVKSWNSSRLWASGSCLFMNWWGWGLGKGGGKSGGPWVQWVKILEGVNGWLLQSEVEEVLRKKKKKMG